MRVGDIVMNKTRYLGQVFMVIDTNKKGFSDDERPNQAVRCVRVGDGYKTRWTTASTWTVVA